MVTSWSHLCLQVQDLYTYLVSLEDLIISKLQAGTKLSSVYHAAMENVKKEKPELADKINKNFGFAMGIEFREGALVIGGFYCFCITSTSVQVQTVISN